MEVSAALKTVTVAKAKGDFEVESVSLPLIMPCAKMFAYRQSQPVKKRSVLFMKKNMAIL